MKKLEKFNAETTPLGTELITRDGRKVSEWHYFKSRSSEYKVVCLVDDVIYINKVNGFYRLDDKENDNDLFIKPKVSEVWVNIYQSSDGKIRTGVDFYSREEAIDHKQYVEGYIKTVRITDEVEQS